MCLLDYVLLWNNRNSDHENNKKKKIVKKHIKFLNISQ